MVILREIPMDQHEQTLSIQDLSLKLEIPKSTLRFWEREFEGFLVPLRTKGGQRRYTAENIIIIKKVKRLREKGVSLAATHAHLMKEYPAKMDKVHPNRIDFLANRVAEVVRDEVCRFFQKEGRQRPGL